jgi:hypothetical protein
MSMRCVPRRTLVNLWKYLAVCGVLLLAGGCGGTSSVPPIKANLDARSKAALDAIADPPGMPLRDHKKPSAALASAGTATVAGPAATGDAAAVNAAAAPAPTARPEKPGDDPPPLVRVATVAATAAPRSLAAAPEAAAAVPIVPAELEAWNDGDFLLARLTDDRRLVAALDERAAHPQQTTAEAEMLAALLRPDPSGMLPMGLVKKLAKKNVSPPSALLVKAVVLALVANDTPAARHTLAAMLQGEFAAGPSRELPATAAAALLRAGSAACEEPVLQAALAPAAHGVQAITYNEGVATATGGNLVGSLRQYASSRLRKRLADGLFQDSVSAAQRSALLAMLTDASLVNLPAQTVLYANPGLERTERIKLEKHFAAVSSTALATLMKLGDKKQSPTLASIDMSGRIGGLLWNNNVIEELAQQHRGAESLANLDMAVALATTIPADAMRSGLRRFLMRHWSEGPKAITTAAADQVHAEPGLIAVLKSIARETAANKTVAPPHFGKPRTGGGDDARANDWEAHLQTLLEDYCRRCWQAGLSSGTAAPLSRDARQAAGLVALPSDSKIACAYHVDWPGEHAAALPEAARGVWQLDYVRIETRARPSRPVMYFRRSLKHLVEHPVPRGLWMDGFSETASEGRSRSTDVFVRLVDAGKSPNPNEEQELTVEILSVDVARLHP